MIIVKVGGSLFDHPKLGPGLLAFVESLAPAEVLLVPGGGPVADAVRELDRTHGLGEEAAHWLALRALSVTAAFLERVAGGPPPPAPLPEGKGVTARDASSDSPEALGLRRSCSPPFPRPARSSADRAGEREEGLGVGSSCRVLDCFAFAREDESRPGALPHSWSVTTDSVAARAALVFRAERLILLKSTDVPDGTPWDTAAANGWVDAHFPRIARALTCPVEVINFRRRLGANA
ncbi:amino acid kinase family protein [Frigoriglobus tundricola]|uniref:Aspartate/glutamate/uridylate kinase domain-containing protein n=1 Tax=Frigoriglobus tundricola TaxID=2774151 RepID=A0A6M5YSZ5_9BACT|nr:hypothetical protein [Frigoriglobus tundricola]QJW97197.1 hypothetical protein FTUN_4762 [Frigoriglobus tundricola]